MLSWRYPQWLCQCVCCHFGCFSWSMSSCKIRFCCTWWSMVLIYSGWGILLYYSGTNPSWGQVQGTSKLVILGGEGYLSTWSSGARIALSKRMDSYAISPSLFVGRLGLYSLATLFVIDSIVVEGGGSGNQSTVLINVKCWITRGFLLQGNAL